MMMYVILIILFSFMMAEDEREFDYIRGSEMGPERWGEIRPEWATCSTGEMQSPIDLLDARVKVTPRSAEINRLYRPTRAMLRNRGHDIEVVYLESCYYFICFTRHHILSIFYYTSMSIHLHNMYKTISTFEKI